VKIPFTRHEVTGHAPGEEAHHSVAKTNNREPSTLAGMLRNALPFKIRSTGEQAVAQRLRGKFGHLAMQAAVRARARTAAAPTPIALRDSTPEVNARCAKETLRAVRLALYTRATGSNKSDNKFTPARGQAETARLANTIGNFAVTDFPGEPNARYVSAARSKNIWESTAINCMGLAHACLDYAAHKYPGVQASLVSVPGHKFVAIGNIGPAEAGLPLAQWPARIHIVDPWTNIECSAPEYPAKFAAKMAKWEGNGKLLRTDAGDLVSPLDRQWTSCLDDAPAEVLRRQAYKDGQFENIRIAPDDRVPPHP
jgi:hypothetical protein